MIARLPLVAAALLVACGAAAHEGWGVVVHDRLGVVFSDIPGNTIWRLKDGRFEALLRDIHSHALVGGTDDAIYGTNPEPAGPMASVWRLDADGRFSYVVPPAANHLLGLQSFFISDDGTIHSASRYDHRKPMVMLLRRDVRGQVSPAAGGYRFTAIDGIRQDRDGSLIVVDGASLRRVRGDAVTTLAGPLTRMRLGEDLLGLSSIHGDTIHVADHAGRRVLRVSLTTGKAEPVDASSFFWAPAGVEWSHDTLFVLEHLRPPLSLLGDLQVGPYLRLRAIGYHGSIVGAVVWGRHTAAAAFALAGVVLAAGVWLTRRRKRH